MIGSPHADTKRPPPDVSILFMSLFPFCVREYVDVCIHMSTSKNKKMKKMMRILVVSKCESIDPTH
jgi:hypothetical protein